MLLAVVAFGLSLWGRTPPRSAAPRTAITGPATDTGQREAMPTGNIAGWREVFSDDFDGRSLDTHKWRLYWGQPGGDPAGWFDPSHVGVSDGMLVISAYRDPRDGNRWTSGGVSSSPGLVQTYGKYLVRFRLDPGVGIAHGLLLVPADHSWPPEIDFSEDNGTKRLSTLATLHYGSADKTISKGVVVNLTRWHTLGVEWTPASLRYTLDGRVWLVMRSSSVPAVPMVMDLQTQAWPCVGTWEHCPDSNTPRVVRMYVDWVVAYAPAGGR
jgi:beta-glucanase (GH16 family)